MYIYGMDTLSPLVGDELYEAHLSWYHSRFIGDGGTPTYVHETLCMGASVSLLYWPTSPICWVLYVVWTSSLLELA